MAKTNSYYKITDPETLQKIEAFMDKRDQFMLDVNKLCEHYGFKHYNMSESIQNGIRFWNLLARKDDVVNTDKWKTSKRKDGYLALEPRASNKHFKAEYLAMKPKSLEYTELNKIILKDEVLPWSTAYGYTYKKGQHFMFETTLEVCDQAIEILGSEYRATFGEGE